MTDDSVSTRIVNVNLESLPMEKSSSTESTDLQPFEYFTIAFSRKKIVFSRFDHVVECSKLSFVVMLPSVKVH